MPLSIHLHASKYSSTCLWVFTYIPLSIHLHASEYSPTCLWVFTYMPLSIHLHASEYSPTCLQKALIPVCTEWAHAPYDHKHVILNFPQLWKAFFLICAIITHTFIHSSSRDITVNNRISLNKHTRFSSRVLALLLFYNEIQETILPSYHRQYC